jgi:hypothetical protein
MSGVDVERITPAQARKLLAQLDVDAIREHGFAEFVKRAWHVFETTRDLEWNWHLDEACVHAEACMPPWREDGSKPWEPRRPGVGWAAPMITDLAVNQPPGTTKSAIWTVMWNAWVWTWRPEARWICVAFAPALINDLSERCYKLVTSPWYRERWPASCQTRRKATPSSGPTPAAGATARASAVRSPGSTPTSASLTTR